MLAPLTCAVVLLISGVAKVGRPAATRDAFISMGRAPAPCAPRRWSPRCRTSRSPSACSCWSPGRGRWRSSRPRRRRCSRRTGCSCSACCGAARRSTAGASEPSATTGSRARRWRATPCWWCSPPSPRPSEPPARVCCPRCGDFGTADWWWLVAHGRGGGHRGARGGAAPTRSRRSTTTTCSTTSAPPSPSPCWRTRPAPAPRSRSWPAERPQLLVFLSSSCWACETVAAKLPDVESAARPGRGLDGLHRAPGASPARDDAARRRPRLVRRREGATETFADGTTVRRPAGGRRSPGRRARRRCGRRRHVRRGHRGRAGRRPGAAGAGRSREHASIGTPTTTASTTATVTASDDGHGHA